MLVAAYQLGVTRARADMDVGFSGQVIGATGDLVWTRDDACWILSGGTTGWSPEPTAQLPVPPAEVKFLNGPGQSGVDLITTTDVGSKWSSGSWTNCGSLPTGPVPVEGQSFGKIKAQHRQEGSIMAKRFFYVAAGILMLVAGSTPEMACRSVVAAR
jgi:hypothetical protein